MTKIALITGAGNSVQRLRPGKRNAHRGVGGQNLQAP
jgi:hypothetical protein